MSDRENQEPWYSNLINPIIKGIKHSIYISIIFIILGTLCSSLFNISLKAVMKDYVSKEFGQNSYLSKKLDELMYLHSSYNGFDRYKMIQETDNFINKYEVKNIGRELDYLSPFISKNSLQTYKSLYKDLHMFHYDLIFNKFDYNKDKALMELYNILLKYRCSLEKANQELFKSKLDEIRKQNFIKDIIASKVKDLSVEIIIYTKSITIEEFNHYKAEKEKEALIDKNKLWENLILNYYFEYMNIVRGGICEENLFEKSNSKSSLDKIK